MPIIGKPENWMREAIRSRLRHLDRTASRLRLSTQPAAAAARDWSGVSTRTTKRSNRNASMRPDNRFRRRKEQDSAVHLASLSGGSPCGGCGSNLIDHVDLPVPAGGSAILFDGASFTDPRRGDLASRRSQ